MINYKLFTRIISIFALLMICDISGSAAEVNFGTPFYSVNLNGDMTTLGNTIIWKDTAAANAYGVDVATSVPTDRNNAYNMKFVDVLSDGAVTFNSSSSSLSIPAGCTVKWAGLYWQGHIVNTALEAGADNSKIGIGANANAIYNDAKSKANSIYFKLPSGLDYNLTAEVYYDYPTDLQGMTDRRYLYSGFYNITNYVKTAGNGSYTVGNLRTSEGTISTWGGLGGWAMLVVYEDPSGTLQLKNISLFHGYRVLNSGQSQDINVSGFYTPTAGTINASLAVFVADGDKEGSNNTGEHLKMWNTSSALTDINNSANPLLNVFNSSITNFGVDNVARTPSFSDNLGIDIDRFDVSSYMSHGQNSTKIQVSTAGDLFTLDLIAFATDVYQPKICYLENIFKGTANISGIGAQVNQDDNLTVRVYVKNVGNEVANGVSLNHQFDTSFPYAVNSANYNNSNPPYEILMPPTYTRTTATDSSGNDLYEYNSTSLVAKINLGTGATNSSGGTFNPNTTFAAFEYTASVNIMDNNYSNVYKAAYVNNALGIDYSANPITLSSCDGSVNSFYGYAPPLAAGRVDEVDPDMFATYTTAPVIKTKVAQKSGVQLTAVYIDPTTLAPKNFAVSLGNHPLQVFLYRSNETCTDEQPLAEAVTGSPSGQPVIANITVGTTNANTNTFAIRALAQKDTRVKAKFADWSQILSGLSSKTPCFANSNMSANFNGLPQCLNSLDSDHSGISVELLTKYPNIATTCLNQALGTYSACQSSAYDASGSKGGIYPSKYDHAYGCLACILDAIPDISVCSRDNFAIRPERMNVTSAHADMPNLLRSAQDYNTTLHAYNYGTTTDTQDYNVTAANTVFTVTTTKYNRNNVITPSMVGTSTFAAGDFNISNGVSVKSGIGGNEVAGLTFDDVGKINIRMEDRIWSAVDVNDTLQDCSANGAYVCGDKNVTFIPEHFDFNELNISNNNGSPGTFTYLGNEVNLMAGRIHTQMRSLNKNGAVTQNFATAPLWENPINVVPVVRTASYLYTDANETTIANLAVNFAAGVKTIPWNETNTSQYLRFNFQRDINPATPPSPFDVIGADLNISLTSAYTDPEDGGTATIRGDRNATAGGGSRFVYGRIIPRDVRVFGAVAYTANGWYEVYNSPSIGVTTLPPSRNGNMWYINVLHNDMTDGDGNVTRLQQGGASAAANIVSGALNGIESYSFGAAGAVPYSAKAHIDTDPWLWYGNSVLPYADPSAANIDCLTHPCFNVSVVPSIGTTGSSNTAGEGSKTDKRTTLGSGWHSTRDYAPSIR